mgnify:CR=1 FL=1|tara:strand:+ start:337 stop:543 length:207 start_codon:yes stop_codon:yes gene_type:complete
MKTVVIIFLAILFLVTIVCYFGQCKTGKCQKPTKDKRAENIKRAQKNLHPVINRNVDRASNGRFIKKK